MHINPYAPIRPISRKRAKSSDTNPEPMPGDFADEVQASMQDQQRQQAKKQNKPGSPGSENDSKPVKSGIIDTSA